LVDGKTAFCRPVVQTKLATRAHTSLVRAPPDVAAAKIEAYGAMWESAEPLPSATPPLWIEL